MADWTTLPDTTFEPGAPAKGRDMRFLRDNPIAIAEGATGAPRIQTDAYANNSVTTAKIVNANVTAPKLAATSNERDWVLGRTASASSGALGTYAFAEQTGTDSFVFGATSSGSVLAPSNAGGSPSGSLSGTWRCMGRIPGGGSADDRTTLWLRIS